MANYDQQIFDMAVSEGFNPTVAKFIVAQARLESSDYDSPVFMKNNNMYGMKFVNQPLATRGTLAPPNERSKTCRDSNVCKDSDHYAKYKTPIDSPRDVIQRLYKKERKGVGFAQLNNSKTPDEFASLLKQRDYYGATPQHYSAMLKAKLIRMNIVETYVKYKKPIDYTLIGLLLIVGSAKFNPADSTKTLTTVLLFCT
jgi:flagellum-specific peptidoglycan hydrolase FlgJ